MDNKEFRLLIKHCFLMGKNTTKAKQWLDKCYPGTAPSRQTVEYWFAKFKCGETSTDDAARSGRPIDATSEEIATKVHLIVLNDRKIKVREIADMVHISTERVHHILHEHLSMRKLFSRWVPRFLTIDQKQHRINDSESNLLLFKHDPKDFVRRYVTMDETWIHHYTPESNQQSAQWFAHGESREQRPRTQQSAGKVLASVFWDAHGILLIDYLETKKTITGQYYANLLDRLNEAIKIKRPHLAKKKIIFHQDNAPAHTSMIAMAKLHELRYELLPHPPYSPDLAPSDYFLFPNLKRWLQGKKFYTNEEVEWETDVYFEALDKDYYTKGVRMLEKRWTDCIAMKGNYVEK